MPHYLEASVGSILETSQAKGWSGIQNIRKTIPLFNKNPFAKSAIDQTCIALTIITPSPTIPLGTLRRRARLVNDDAANTRWPRIAECTLQQSSYAHHDPGLRIPPEGDIGEIGEYPPTPWGHRVWEIPCGSTPLLLRIKKSKQCRIILSLFNEHSENSQNGFAYNGKS